MFLTKLLFIFVTLNFIQKMKTTAHTLENLYQVFSTYKAPKKIKNFNCYSCVSNDDEHFFFTKPLKELDDSLFGMYFEACNVERFPTIEHKYFIPKLLELYSLETLKSFSFSEYFFDCCSFLDYQNTFLENEKTAINDFFTAYLENEFFSENADQDSHVIINFAIGGFNVIPFLSKLKLKFDLFRNTKNEIKLYIESKKENSKSIHYSNFEEWSNRGEIQKLMHYLSEN
jgi:hypothetical protein